MPTNAIQEAIRRVRNQGAMIRLRTETGYFEIDVSQESDVVTEFTLTIRQQGELHRSRSIDGLTVWKLLSDHDFRVLSKTESEW